jgi:threonine dehydrogenase-like Zn-dependent dehydrogenase
VRAWRCGPIPSATHPSSRDLHPDLLGGVLEGRINPGTVLDYETDLDHVADAYAAMDERRAIKSLVRVGSP